eukprot:3075320-Rhodomonas_salina.1
MSVESKKVPLPTRTESSGIRPRFSFGTYCLPSVNVTWAHAQQQVRAWRARCVVKGQQEGREHEAEEGQQLEKECDNKKRGERDAGGEFDDLHVVGSAREVGASGARVVVGARCLREVGVLVVHRHQTQ